MKKIIIKILESKIFKVLFWGIFWVVNIFEFFVFIFFQWVMFVYPAGQGIERSINLIDLSKSLYYLSAFNSLPMLIVNIFALGIVMGHKKKFNYKKYIAFIVYLLVSSLYSLVQFYSFFY